VSKVSDDTIKERLARTEEQVIGVREALDTECYARNQTDHEIKKALERISNKIDQILHNDRDKLQRIAALETRNKVMLGSGGILTIALTCIALLF
jgi:hypothetical protein